MILGNASAILDNAGAATATVGPQRAGESWRLTRASVAASTGKPTVRLYRGIIAVGAFLDGTKSGDANATEWPGGLTLTGGQSIVAVWSLGTPGAQVSLTVDGEAISAYGVL